jgi:hypothetical protein
MLKPILLLLAAPLVLADGPPPQVRPWLLQEPAATARTVDLQLVRARVRQVRTPDGPLRIEIRKLSGEPTTGARIHVQRTRGAIAVRDIYPVARATRSGECEPSPSGRGDFRHSDVVWDAVIYAPPAVDVQVHVMDPRD